MIAKVTTNRAPPKNKSNLVEQKGALTIRASVLLDMPRSAVAANASSSPTAINTSILVAKTQTHNTDGLNQPQLQQKVRDNHKLKSKHIEHISKLVEMQRMLDEKDGNITFLKINHSARTLTPSSFNSNSTAESSSGNNAFPMSASNIGCTRERSWDRTVPLFQSMTLRHCGVPRRG